MMNTNSPITATLVPENERIPFLIKQLPKLSIQFEMKTFAILSNHAPDYNGAMWDFYQLSNGGFYMSPQGYKELELDIWSNGYVGIMSGDAAGIVACLYALNYLCSRYPSDTLIEQYHALRDFAVEHAELEAILGAID